MRVCVVALLAACGFTRGAATGGPGDGSAQPDAAPDGAIDAPPGSTCLTSDPSLVLCLELDEPGLAAAPVARDTSGLGHDAALSAVTVSSRVVPATSQALALTGRSSLALGNVADFDMSNFTLSAWVKRSTRIEMGIIDTGRQYTLSLNGVNGQVDCAVSSNGQTTAFVIGSGVQSNEWDLVACTYDGTNVCTYSFRNGSASGQQHCAGYTKPIDRGKGLGTTVGSWADGTTHFSGVIDQIRMYSRALTQQELCTAGGLSGC
jgi:hypothetical protein